MLTSLFSDRNFYREATRIALPIAAQNFITSSLNIVDTILIGGLGQVSIAAVGLANQLFFLFFLFLFGVNSGASIFTAQYWGQRDVLNIRRVLGITLVSGIAVASVFTLVSFFFSQPVLRFFSADPEVIRQGDQFLRIVAFSYIPTAATFAFLFILRSTGQVMIPMALSFITFGLNTVLNYLLIYGLFGFPRMEVAGSATATLIARSFEFLAIIAIVYGRKLVPAARFNEMFSFTKEFAGRFFRTTAPVILNEGIWAFGVTMYAVIYAHMGTGIFAAANITGTIDRLSMVLFFGMGQACAVMIGHKIGEGRNDLAFDYAKRFATLGPLLGVVMGALLWLSSGWALSFFRITHDVHTIAGQFILIMAFVLPIRVFNLINIVGIMRSGGDTRFSLFIDTAGLWFIAVPLTFLAGLHWHWPAFAVYLLFGTDELFKFVLGNIRLYSRKWINNLTQPAADPEREIFARVED